ncbi:hypothetical protein, variant [Aphanomyces invadans]|nr:hypothetical protein, variant [Aphanomyces invadans]ETV93082.1 hypothetical protein, variant [Aphanomyces invadans]|eukprot:XP_008878346.1 hypothetical protein, variant [Aphanomyces invadans]
MVQFDRKRLVDAFQIVEHLEKRRRKRVDANKLYLDHSLQPISESAAPSMFHMCRDQLATSLQARVADYFVHPPDQAFAQAFNGMLNNASNLLVDLEYVDRDVASCFPAAIDAVQVFVASYNTALEVQFAKICGKGDLGVAQKLQLVQWIDYYNSQVARYRSGTVSAILDQNANLVMKLYLDGIQEQIHTWVTNIYNRDEEPVVGPSGELHSTRPNDIMNILSSQITIAQEWLSGGLLARVVLACLAALMQQLRARADRFATASCTDMESLCSFVNDTDVLQSKVVELIDKIQFPGSADHADEVAKLNAGLGDALNATSSDIVALAVHACSLIVRKIFDEIDADTTAHWFGKKWDDQEPVVENVLVTLDDFLRDLHAWISGSFFYAKVVRFALDRCVDEYTKRFVGRTAALPNAEVACRVIEQDVMNVHGFFSRYESELRRTGLRTADDVTKHLEPMNMLSLLVSRKLTLDDLARDLHDLDQQGLMDDASAKRAKLLKDVMGATKRLVPLSASHGAAAAADGSKSSKGGKPPKKSTFFKKTKDKTVAKADDNGMPAPPTEDASDAAADFQVKTTSLDAFLNH